MDLLHVYIQTNRGTWKRKEHNLKPENRSNISVNFYRCTQYHIPEDGNILQNKLFDLRRYNNEEYPMGCDVVYFLHLQGQRGSEISNKQEISSMLLTCCSLFIMYMTLKMEV